MSIVVIDLHGDLVKKQMEVLPAAGVDPQRVLLFDATDDVWTPTHNPLAGSGEAHLTVGPFVAALERGSDSWGIQLGESALCGATVLHEAGYSPLEIEALFLNEPFRKSVLAVSRDVYARSFFEGRFENLSSDQQRSWYLALANKLRPILSRPRLRRISGTGDGVAFRRAIDTKGAIVLVSLGSAVLQESAATIGEILVHSLWQTVLARAKVPEAERPKTLLIVDEFQEMGNSIFGQMIAVGRRFGLRLALAHQSQAQLPADLRSIIRNNSALRLLFAPGPVDAGELASELSPLPRHQAYAALMKLSVGQAFVVRRGKEAIPVQMKRPTERRASASQIAEFRHAVLERSARKVVDVDRELQERSDRIAALLSAPSKPVSGKSRSSRRPLMEDFDA